MVPNLTARRYQIISYDKGNPPVGVDGRLLPAVQLVRTNAPDTIWTIRDGDKPSSYRFSVGPYGYTGVFSNKVAGTVHENQDVEWNLTYWEHYNAYTIGPVGDTETGALWTVTDDSPHSTIALLVLPVPLPIPPIIPHRQLFQFIPEDEEDE